MSLYHIITDRFVKPVIEKHREEGRAEGIAEGRAEGIAEGQKRAARAWSEWYQHWMDAEAQGLPFDEPPPGQHTRRNGEQP